jgi:peroxiredoxin family protein
MNESSNPTTPRATPSTSTLENEVRGLCGRLAALEATVASGGTEDRLSMLVFSGTLDRMMAAFVVASTASASGMQVEMFFTFWVLAALRDPKKSAKKDLFGKMFGWVLPRGMRRLPMSQMNMGGAGPSMIRHLMGKKKLASIEEMLAVCAETGVRLSVCDMSRELMGIQPEELIDYPNLGCCGAATFLEKASRGRVTLFI